MKKIVIKHYRTADGHRWIIKNWNDYLRYLDSINVVKPKFSYSVFAGDEELFDMKITATQFSKNVPILFHLRKDTFEIVN